MQTCSDFNVFLRENQQVFVANSEKKVLVAMQGAVGVTNSGHLMWSWMTAGVARLDKNPPSKPPSPDGDVARGVNPPSLPQKEEAMDSPIGVIVPAGLEMETGVLLEYQTHLELCF